MQYLQAIPTAVAPENFIRTPTEGGLSLPVWLEWSNPALGKRFGRLTGVCPGVAPFSCATCVPAQAGRLCHLSVSHRRDACASLAGEHPRVQPGIAAAKDVKHPEVQPFGCVLFPGLVQAEDTMDSMIEATIKPTAYMITLSARVTWLPSGRAELMTYALAMAANTAPTPAQTEDPGRRA